MLLGTQNLQVRRPLPARALAHWERTGVAGTTLLDRPLRPPRRLLHVSLIRTQSRATVSPPSLTKRRLPQALQEMLQVASVEGEEFSAGVVASVLGADEGRWCGG
jgi:hypothetical protein